ncbi:hypothetical protein L596_010293 [Steinernema carpocapsae]|uniref:Uncharacterized protein n=1 Tax=Steinernema carpocapsae TaxID=34508 RepID=A0A4U5PJ80_STECR|nr:hypothetical protein L596_010293 [Steinernema carpocapsae]
MWVGQKSEASFEAVRPVEDGRLLLDTPVNPLKPQPVSTSKMISLPAFATSALVLCLLLLVPVDAKAVRRASNPVKFKVKEKDVVINACSMKLLRNNFLHVFTCRGYVRFAMAGHSYEKLNSKINKLLEANKDLNKDDFCPQVKAFWYSDKEIIFLKYATCKSNKNCDNSVRFWIEDVVGKEGKFTAFPAWNEWTEIGRGFDADTFNKLTDDEKIAKKAMCNPYTFYYNYNKVFETQKSGNPVTLKGEHSGKGVCNQIEQRKDPVLPGKLATRNDDKPHRLVQAYDKHSLHSYQSAKDTSQWYAVFNQRNLEDVEAFKNKKTTSIRTGKLCLLRKYRHDLQEMNEIFMLPAKGLEMVDEKNEANNEAGDEARESSEGETTTKLYNIEKSPDENDEGKPAESEQTENEPDFEEKSVPSVLMVLTAVAGVAFM